MGQTERARAEGSLRALAGSMRRFILSANASQNFILLRSFFTYYFTNIFFSNLPSGLPFWAGCTTRIHLFAYSFCCVEYFGGVFYAVFPLVSTVLRMFQAGWTGWFEGLFSFYDRLSEALRN